jgi:hypothetical protein
MARLLAGQPGRVPAADLQGDLGARVARSDHQDAAVLKLGRANPEAELSVFVEGGASAGCRISGIEFGD